MPGVTGAKIAKPSKTATISLRKMLRRWRNSRGKTEKNAFSTSGSRKMRENLSLDQRIATAFEDGATSDDVSMLIGDRGCQPLRSGGKNAAWAPWEFNAALPPDECSTVIKGPPIQ
jgi:hypothetical protein